MTDPLETSINSMFEEEEKIYLTHDMWHVTHDIWPVTHDRWEEGNLLSKFHLPSSNGLGVKVWRRYFHKGWLSVLTNQIWRVFVEQPRLHRVCWIHKINFLYLIILHKSNAFNFNVKMWTYFQMITKTKRKWEVAICQTNTMILETKIFYKNIKPTTFGILCSRINRNNLIFYTMLYWIQLL